jgi:hypothetical protein
MSDWYQVIANGVQFASNMGTAVAAGFTAFGAWAAVKQLKLMKRQGITSLEDTLSSEYRQLASTLPLRALLGEPLSDEEQAKALDEFYRYFDLCNHQIYLHSEKRISDETWAFWRDGIVTNLKRPAFARAWAEIAARANGDFDELRNLCPPQRVAAALKEAA